MNQIKAVLDSPALNFEELFRIRLVWVVYKRSALIFAKILKSVFSVVKDRKLRIPFSPNLSLWRNFLYIYWSFGGSTLLHLTAIDIRLQRNKHVCHLQVHFDTGSFVRPDSFQRLPNFIFNNACFTSNHFLDPWLRVSENNHYCSYFVYVCVRFNIYDRSLKPKFLCAESVGISFDSQYIHFSLTLTTKVKSFFFYQKANLVSTLSPVFPTRSMLHSIVHCSVSFFSLSLLQ